MKKQTLKAALDAMAAENARLRGDLDQAWVAARDAARDAARHPARDAARELARETARETSVCVLRDDDFQVRH